MLRATVRVSGRSEDEVGDVADGERLQLPQLTHLLRNQHREVFNFELIFPSEY